MTLPCTVAVLVALTLSNDFPRAPHNPRPARSPRSASSAACADPGCLLSWWPAEGLAADVLSTNHGTEAGDAGYAPGQVGQAFALDGDGDFIELPPAALDGLAAVTFEGWVRPASLRYQNVFAALLTGTQIQFVLRIDSTAGDLLFQARNATPESRVVVGPPISVDAWTHLAAVFEAGQSLRLYLDGVDQTLPPPPPQPAGPFPDNNPLITNIGTLRIGAESTAGSGTFHGLIDEATVHPCVLTPAEIFAIYSAGAAGKCR